MPGTANSIVTDAGIAAAIAGGIAGPLVQITGFRLGSQSATEGASAAAADTNVDGLVFTGGTSYMTASIQSSDSILFRIMLGQEVGDFMVGQVGLMMGSTLFSKHVMEVQTYKTNGDPPTTLGNVKVFDCVLRLTNVANLLDISFISAMYASLPEVATELLLPPAISSTYSAYVVQQHTRSKRPTTAVRVGSNWSHISHFEHPSQGVGVMPVVSTLFHADAPIGKVVYWSVADAKFRAYDGAIPTLSPVGLRTATAEITTIGLIPRTVAGIGSAMATGSIYYAATSPLGGLYTPGAAAQGQPIAIALTADDLFINCAYSQFLGGFRNTFCYGVDTGSANAIGVSIPDYGPGSTLYEGKSFVVKVAATNTLTSVTLSLNGGAGLPVKTSWNTNPPIGSLVAGQMLECVYHTASGGTFRILSPINDKANDKADVLKDAYTIRSRIALFTSPGALPDTSVSSGGNFIVPADVYCIEVEMVGGGGGGAFSNPNWSGGGGGSGGYTIKGFINVTPGQTIAGYVGAGGAQNTDGIDTTFGSALAERGRGSPAVAAGNASSPYAPVAFSVTTGFSSSIILSGQQGDGGVVVPGTLALGGRGGSTSAGGMGGNPTYSTVAVNANPGLQPGGGGGGAASGTASTRNGGAGATGWILIRY